MRPGALSNSASLDSGQTADLLSDGAMPIAEAVRWSGIGRSRLYYAMARGDLAYIKVGDRRLIPRAALRTYLAQRLEGAEM